MTAEPTQTDQATKKEKPMSPSKPPFLDVKRGVAVYFAAAVAIGIGAQYWDENKSDIDVDRDTCTVKLSYKLSAEKAFWFAEYDFKKQTVDYYFGRAAVRTFDFKALSPMDRAEARKMADELPQECRFQQKFDL